jgi:hypothetical protein
MMVYIVYGDCMRKITLTPAQLKTLSHFDISTPRNAIGYNGYVVRSLLIRGFIQCTHSESERFSEVTKNQYTLTDRVHHVIGFYC